MSSQYPNIFSVGRIGQMNLKNRIVMPAMGTAYASSDGTASERWLKYLTEKTPKKGKKP